MFIIPSHFAFSPAPLHIKQGQQCTNHQFWSISLEPWIDRYTVDRQCEKGSTLTGWMLTWMVLLAGSQRSMMGQSHMNRPTGCIPAVLIPGREIPESSEHIIKSVWIVINLIRSQGRRLDYFSLRAHFRRKRWYSSGDRRGCLKNPAFSLWRTAS